MEERRGGGFLFLFIGLIGSLLCGFVGYLVAGAMGIGQEQGIGFGNGLVVVLSNPFGKYLNNYTPILILLGFILFETVFIMFLFTRKKEEPLNEDEYKPDIIDLVDIDVASVMDEKSNTADMSDYSLFGEMAGDVHGGENSNKGSSDEKYVSPSAEMTVSPAENESAEDIDDKLSFGSEIMDEMLGEHYTLDQMVAMINIKKYMKDVSAELLKRMFSPEMSPEEISEYISLFFE